jgi:ribosomal protein L32
MQVKIWKEMRFMALANCPQCGKLYLENPLHMCPDCRDEYERQVEIVLDYMRNVPRATVLEISAATGIKEKIIYDLIKRGALIGSNCVLSYPCGKCGKLIDYGKFCDECLNYLNKELGLTSKKQDYEAPETKFSQKSNSKWQSY